MAMVKFYQGPDMPKNSLTICKEELKPDYTNKLNLNFQRKR